MKEHERPELQIHIFLIHALATLLPGKDVLEPISRRLVGPQISCELCRKEKNILTLPGFAANIIL
jgi:hypothetical protein